MGVAEKHALLSPSSAHRWLECTPSARLEETSNIIDAPSPYAREGTEAHSLAELKLSYMLGKISPKVYGNKFELFLSSSEFYNTEFNEYVTNYCNEVMNIITMDYENQEIEVHLEAVVTFEDIVPKGSGTSDVVIVGKDFIHIIDLKFGRGVAVSAIDNSQLKLYALGALRKYRLNGVFTKARMTIIQPRLNDITTDEMVVSDLNDWALNYVKPRAELAMRGEGAITPGDHCKFCKIKHSCEALATQQLKRAQEEFELTVTTDDTGVPTILEPNQMSPDMLARILEIGPKFSAWFKEVTEYAKKSMVYDGLELPGFKVVRGVSRRVITDQDRIAEILRTNGYDEADYLSEPKLLSLTKLEKNIGKKMFNQLAGDYIIKPEGKPIVVSADDKREAISASEFKLIGQEFED